MKMDNYYGTLSRTYEGATRTHILRTYPTDSDKPQKKHGYEDFVTPSVTLRSGDIMTVFNSVAAGDILWKGSLHFLGKNPDTGAHPMGVQPLFWKAMFQASLPVKLNKVNGDVIDGTLFRWNEQGSDDCYSIFDYHNKGYDSVHSMSDGDYLEVFSSVTKGNVLWQGELKMSPVAMPTGAMGLKFDDDGIWRGQRAPEYVNNAFITPSIKIVREWPHVTPIKLQRK